MSTTPERFDSQASIFEERAGLAPEVAEAVAKAVVDVSGAKPDDVVFEIGAGTGEIGLHLAQLAGYVGIDRSDGMLSVFRARLDDSSRVQLLRHDADERWPVDDASVTAVFGSRVVHLLDPERLRNELSRVLRPGGAFLVGRVIRDRESARGRLRQQRQRALRDHGVKAPQAEKITQNLLDDLIDAGAEPIEAKDAASWSVTISPAEILDQWAQLTSMGGASLDDNARDAILNDVRAWAERELGDLTRPDTSTETYRVSGVRIGGTSAPASV